VCTYVVECVFVFACVFFNTASTTVSPREVCSSSLSPLAVKTRQTCQLGTSPFGNKAYSVTRIIFGCTALIDMTVRVCTCLLFY
jgi:hypothetical protein